jgi:hypothetical protein
MAQIKRKEKRESGVTIYAPVASSGIGTNGAGIEDILLDLRHGLVESLQRGVELGNFRAGRHNRSTLFVFWMLDRQCQDSLHFPFARQEMGKIRS